MNDDGWKCLNCATWINTLQALPTYLVLLPVNAILTLWRLRSLFQIFIEAPENENSINPRRRNKVRRRLWWKALNYNKEISHEGIPSDFQVIAFAYVRLSLIGIFIYESFIWCFLMRKAKRTNSKKTCVQVKVRFLFWFPPLRFETARKLSQLFPQHHSLISSKPKIRISIIKTFLFFSKWIFNHFISIYYFVVASCDVKIFTWIIRNFLPNGNKSSGIFLQFACFHAAWAFFLRSRIWTAAQRGTNFRGISWSVFHCNLIAPPTLDPIDFLY